MSRSTSRSQASLTSSGVMVATTNPVSAVLCTSPSRSRRSSASRTGVRLTPMRDASLFCDSAVPADRRASVMACSNWSYTPSTMVVADGCTCGSAAIT